MRSSQCPSPVLPEVLSRHAPAWPAWRAALATAWATWRRHAQARELRASLRDLDARTLCDIGLGEFGARPDVTLSTLDWELGRW